MTATANGRAPREDAEPTYRRVAELVRAGMTAKGAAERVADELGRDYTTIAARYYTVKRRLEGPQTANRKSAPTDTRTTSTAGRTPRTPRAGRSTASPGGLAEALDEAAAIIANAAVLVRSLEADAARWRAIAELARDDPDA